MSWRTVVLRLCAALVIVVTVACAPRRNDETGPRLVAVSIEITNNLGVPLRLSVGEGSAALWTGDVAARGSTKAALGEIPVTQMLFLRALDQRGTVVSQRDSIPVESGTLVWVIP